MSVEATVAALADPTRFGVVGLLRAGPQRPADLAGALGVTAPALSRHLRVLREAGLIDEQTPAEDRRVRMIHLRPAPFDELSGWAAELTAFWSGQLDAFAAHLARRGEA